MRAHAWIRGRVGESDAAGPSLPPALPGREAPPALPVPGEAPALHMSPALRTWSQRLEVPTGNLSSALRSRRICSGRGGKQGEMWRRGEIWGQEKAEGGERTGGDLLGNITWLTLFSLALTRQREEREEGRPAVLGITLRWQLQRGLCLARPRSGAATLRRCAPLRRPTPSGAPRAARPLPCVPLPLPRAAASRPPLCHAARAPAAPAGAKGGRAARKGRLDLTRRSAQAATRRLP